MHAGPELVPASCLTCWSRIIQVDNVRSGISLLKNASCASNGTLHADWLVPHLDAESAVEVAQFESRVSLECAHPNSSRRPPCLCEERSCRSRSCSSAARRTLTCALDCIFFFICGDHHMLPVCNYLRVLVRPMRAVNNISTRDCHSASRRPQARRGTDQCVNDRLRCRLAIATSRSPLPVSGSRFRSARASERSMRRPCRRITGRPSPSRKKVRRTIPERLTRACAVWKDADRSSLVQQRSMTAARSRRSRRVHSRSRRICSSRVKTKRSVPQSLYQCSLVALG